MINGLRRPRLLIRAAKLGVKEYDRTRHLRRLLGHDLPGHPGAAILRLMEIEQDFDVQRRQENGSYSLSRHLDVLIAIIGEAQLLMAAHPDTGGRPA